MSDKRSQTTPGFLSRLRQLNELSDDHLRAKEDLLRSAGWSCSSDYPGALWLWSKSFPESAVQWVWRGKEKVPHPAFAINGATTEIALLIEAGWQDVWQ